MALLIVVGIECWMLQLCILCITPLTNYHLSAFLFCFQCKSSKINSTQTFTITQLLYNKGGAEGTHCFNFNKQWRIPANSHKTERRNNRLGWKLYKSGLSKLNFNLVYKIDSQSGRALDQSVSKQLQWSWESLWGKCFLPLLPPVLLYNFRRASSKGSRCSPDVEP